MIKRIVLTAIIGAAFLAIMVRAPKEIQKERDESNQILTVISDLSIMTVKSIEINFEN